MEYFGKPHGACLVLENATSSTVDANFWLTLRAQPVKWIPVAKAELFGTTKVRCHRSHNLKPCIAAIMLLVWGDKYRLVGAPKPNRVQFKVVIL